LQPGGGPSGAAEALGADLTTPGGGPGRALSALTRRPVLVWLVGNPVLIRDDVPNTYPAAMYLWVSIQFFY